jgi:hypothetical protein
LIIYGLVYISMTIRYCVLLSMLPSPVAVRFNLSQQLIWVFWVSFSAHRFWGGREKGDGQERGGDQKRGGGGKADRGRGEREEQKGTHSDNGERTRAALPGFTLYL